MLFVISWDCFLSRYFSDLLNKKTKGILKWFILEKNPLRSLQEQGQRKKGAVVSETTSRRWFFQMNCNCFRFFMKLRKSLFPLFFTPKHCYSYSVNLLYCIQICLYKLSEYRCGLLVLTLVLFTRNHSFASYGGKNWICWDSKGVSSGCRKVNRFWLIRWA